MWGKFLPLLIPFLILSIENSSAQESKSKKIFKIGVTQTASHPDFDADAKGFEKALADGGFKEGNQVTFLRQNAKNDIIQAQIITQKFIDTKVDLIHSIATLTSQTVMKRIKDVPIVFSSVTNPLGAGLVPKTSLPGTKSGTNVTGVSDRWSIDPQFEMYTKFFPKAKRWGTIYNGKDPRSLRRIKEVRKIAARLGVEMIEATISKSEETMQAAQFLTGKVKAIYILPDRTASVSFDAIVKVCNEKKVPLFASDVSNVSRGAMAAYGVDYFLIGYSAGRKAVQILNGESPGDIPWGPAERLSLVINEKAAKHQGVVIPPDLLKKADKVIRN